MSKQKTLTREEAKIQRRNLRIRPYTGPLLQGERTVISQADSSYPAQLLDARNPPEKLYCIGSIEALSGGLAVVGARKATPYGRACTQKFSIQAAERGIPIISGGARGCDSVSHRAAIEAGTPTVAFLGGGCDQLYPASNHKLFQKIIDTGGVIVSEHDWNFPTLPYTFRERNRLIAGLARAVLIVEAGLPSGTFSTADEALTAGRDVLVVPGSICSPTSAGSNRLLYQGAYPIVSSDSFEDALNRIFSLLKQESMIDDNPYGAYLNNQPGKHDVLLEALLANPMRIDSILRDVSPLITDRPDPIGWVQVHLAELERDHLIARYPDGRFGPMKA